MSTGACIDCGSAELGRRSLRCAVCRAKHKKQYNANYHIAWKAKHGIVNTFKLPLHIRFWKKVQRSDVGCWEWIAQLDISGYGIIRRAGMGSKSEKAHRISWELANGPIPDGLLVLHHCDNRRCVRPDHLFLGTNRDNTQDALRKGRLATWKTLPHAKLSDVDVAAIREHLATGERQRDIAALFGISPTIISQINRGYRQPRSVA